MRNLLFALLTTIAGTAYGTVLDVTPGSLGDEVTVDPTVTDLTLRGEIDGRDLQYIADNLHFLRKLDLAGVKIAALKEGKRLTANLRCHAADILPPYSLAGVTANEIILPASITTICDGALMGSGITSITIPAPIEEIGMGAFAGCKDLTAVEIPSSVIKVGTHLFKDCIGLKKISFASAAVPDNTFTGCETLTDVKIGNNVEEIGDEAFYSTGITMADLSGCSRLRHIGARAFAECKELAEVWLPEGMVEIGSGAFFGDTKLTNINLPANLAHLPDMAFTGASALTNSEGTLLPESLETIGTLALAHLSEARTAVLPAGLTEIGDYAFEGWNSLEAIDATALRTIPALGENVWLAVEQPNVTLTVPGEMLDEFKEAPQWKEFNITGAGGTSGIKAPTSAGEGMILARFEGMTLHVIAPEEIATATLHDIAGVRLASLSADGTSELRIDTTPWQTQIFILSLTIGPQRHRVTLKIKR